MKFSEKLSLFRAGKLSPDTLVGQAELKGIGVPNGRHLNNLLFEPGVSLGSGSPVGTAQALIGAHSYMNDGGYFRGSLIIGRYVSIGRRVTIGAGDHWTSGLSTSPRLMGGPPERAYSPEEIERLGTIRATPADTTVTIGHDVWVGDGVIITQGRTIGVGAVIGANAVVTRDVPPYTVVGGTPARRLNQRFPDEIVAELLASEWWELPFERLKEMPLGNVLKCLSLFAQLQPHDVPTFRLGP